MGRLVKPNTIRRKNKSDYFSIATNSKNQKFSKVGEYKYCLLDNKGTYTNYVKFSNSKEKLLKDFEEVKFGNDFKKNFIIVETEIIKNKVMKDGGNVKNFNYTIGGL
jgi:hypothetical protein